MNSQEAFNNADFFLRAPTVAKARSSEEAINNADLLLRAPESAKPRRAPKPEDSPHPAVKEELQVLRLSQKAQETVMDTLKFIHGNDFKLENISDYVDKGSSIGGRYWVGRGNLVIKAVTDYSNLKKEPENDANRIKMFAVLRLESYGFHSEHCQEALEYCDDSIEEALIVLHQKYLKYEPKDLQHIDFNEEDLLQQRIDEKSVLESIYEGALSEKVKNKVWIITLKLDHILKLYNKNVKQKETSSKYSGSKKKAVCRNYIKTKTCKYGSNCRFSHPEDPLKDVNEHLNEFNFYLEIRFPQNSKYPYEPPVIFLKTDEVLPPQVNLHICKFLHREALKLAEDGMPFLYSIIELLKNDEEVVNYLKNSEIDFLSHNEKLFPDPLEVVDLNKLNRPSHYAQGRTNKDNKRAVSLKDTQAENVRIQKNFVSRQSDARYQKMQNSRSKLPAASYEGKILEALDQAQVVVVSGETGCGKSTQVPQFILDQWLNNFDGQKRVEIVCTQPRRISAIGVAERVAEERLEKVGQTVGYQIRLESKISNSTRLCFCTTGILLRRLELDPSLRTVTHVIVDEVHERSEESDFLLLILRDLMAVRKDLKVILMSATLNAAVFADYFGQVPILEIPGRTFPVEQIFLEDLLEKSDYVFDESCQFARKVRHANIQQELEVAELQCVPKPRNNVKDENLRLSELMARYEGYSIKTNRTLLFMDPDKVNLDLIEHTLSWIVSNRTDYVKQGSILVFLPGIGEIKSLYEQLACSKEFNPKHGNYMLIPLHSSLSSAEQALVFEKPKDPNCRKIVLSTNIAETSITIDDCTFVIDAGKMKEKHFDSNRNMESLETVWVTRANALQRRGRAGRVMSGVCVHLYTLHRFKHNMQAHPVPEILRVPLERLVLNIKMLFADSTPHEILGKTLEPPTTESIDSSMRRLQNVGALDSDHNLTPLGRHLAALPVDVRIGKLMLFGAIFSCLDNALTMAACLSYKTPFVVPFGMKDKANQKRAKFACALSDQLTVLNAYKRFQEVSKKGFMAGLNFARENYLSHKTLLTIADVKFQFLEQLVSIGFVPIDMPRKCRTGSDNVLGISGVELNKNGDNNRILTSVLCAALYPNVVKILQPKKSFIPSPFGAIAKELDVKDYKFKTKQEQVFVHPSSLIAESKNFPSSFMVYQEKVKTSKIFIRDCSVITAIPLVLFSGFDVNINVHDGTTFLVLDDNWIMFQAEEHRVAEMLKMIRVELRDLLDEKIQDPLLNLQHHPKGERIISTIMQLVTSE